MKDRDNQTTLTSKKMALIDMIGGQESEDNQLLLNESDVYNGIATSQKSKNGPFF